MKLRAIGLCLILVACGARTEPIGFQAATSVGGQSPSKGGSSQTAIGGNVGVGGSDGIGGSTGPVFNGGSGGTAGTESTTPRRWLVVRQGSETAPKLSLIGVREDNRIEVDALPPYDSSSSVAYGDPVFTKSGKRFVYTTGILDKVRFWVVTLDSTTFSTQEVKLPSAARSFGTWLSETLFSVRTVLATPPGLDPIEVEARNTIFASLDPNEPLPTGAVAWGDRSPDGTLTANARNYVDNYGSTIEVRRVTELGLMGDVVYATVGISQWSWAPQGARLLLVLGPSASPSAMVLDLQPNGTNAVVDKFGPIGSYLVGNTFSPDGRHLAYQASLSNGVETRVRDVVMGTESVLRDATGASSYSGLIWVGNNRLLVTGTNSNQPLNGFNVASITETTVAQGATVLRQLADPYGASSTLWTTSRLGEETFLVTRSLPTNRVVQEVTLTDTAALSTDLLPGLAGEAIPTYVFEGQARHGLQSFLVPADPSYYYLVFDGTKLTRSVKLHDHFGDTYKWHQDAGADFGIVAANVKTQGEFAWLYLDREQPGPLVTIPLERSGMEPQFFIPNE